jgi:hypothetical protein
MSWIELRDRSRDSPERARSLFTVRAAISSARSSPVPRSSWLCFMCSYWLNRLQRLGQLDLLNAFGEQKSPSGVRRNGTGAVSAAAA